jgi:hypothetical protein|uniref:C2H2-type domain-containing protein n=1 Tax=Fagus sylvatica TaxID=28930 RepID=A0A2N9ERY7_FAGSY
MEAKSDDCLCHPATSNEVDAPSKLDLNLSDYTSSSKSSLASSNEVHKIAAKRGQYSCNYCDQKFSSAQALGGHQNGHRNERALAKRVKTLKNMAYLRHIESGGYLDMVPLPLPLPFEHAFSGNLGVHMQYSMNHQPNYYPRPNQHMPIAMSLQSAMPRLRMEDYCDGSGGSPLQGMTSFNNRAMLHTFGGISGCDDQQKGIELKSRQHSPLGLDLSLKL